MCTGLVHCSEHQNHFTIITSVADLTDHVDESGYQHYVAKLGTVQVDSTVIDDRGQSGSGGSGAIPDTFALWKRSMAEAGYDLIGQFGSKLTINNAKQVLLSKDGIEVYAWLGALPKEVGKNDTTDNSGGVGVGAWSPITNELLRSAIISFSGKLAAEPAWPDVPKHADPAMASGLDAQAMALLGRIEKLNERANQKAISLYDKGGVPDIDCTASILAALSSTAGSIVVPAGDWLATPTLANVHQVLAVLSRLHAEGNLLIRVPDGTAVGGATALCNLSGSGAVSVVGATTPTLNSITGFVSASGVAGAWDVTLQMNSVAGMTVGDFLHTTDVTGTGAAAIHRGCWPILAINTGSNQVTVRNNCWKAAFPTHTISSSNTYCIKSVLKFNNSDGFFGRRGQLFMDNVIVRGNASDYWLKTNVSGTEKGTHGIYAGGPSVSLNGKADAVNPTGLSGASFGLGKMVGVYDFDQQGIVTELGGWIWGDFVSSCFNRRRGFYASTSSGIRAKHISACGNYLDGAICDIGGQLYASSSSCAAGNGQRGITASSTGSIVFDSGLLVANGLDGGYATSNGMIQATSATVIQNGGNGLLGEYGGTVYCNNSNISDNGNHGLYGATCSVFRANNCTINNNGAFGVRGDLGAYINYQGSTFSGNASGEVTLAGDAKVTKDSNFGGAMYGSQLNIRYLTTGNGVQLSPLSGGEAMSFGFDTAAANKYTVSYILSSNGNGFYPSADDYQALGRASNRWKTLFAGDGAINTSDGREKIAPLAITDTVLDAWADVELITFQWLDSIQQKGEDVARWHYGVIAQQVRDSFAAHDIDGTRFGLLCYDEWDDEFEPIMEWREDPKTGLMEEFDTGDVRQTLAAGNRWGIRPDQCLFLEAALQRRKMKRLEERVAELEGSR